MTTSIFRVRSDPKGRHLLAVRTLALWAVIQSSADSLDWLAAHSPTSSATRSAVSPVVERGGHGLLRPGTRDDGAPIQQY